MNPTIALFLSFLIAGTASAQGVDQDKNQQQKYVSLRLGVGAGGFHALEQVAQDAPGAAVGLVVAPTYTIENGRRKLVAGVGLVGTLAPTGVFAEPFVEVQFQVLNQDGRGKVFLGVDLRTTVIPP